jgi:hypothetical protein
VLISRCRAVSGREYANREIKRGNDADTARWTLHTPIRIDLQHLLNYSGRRALAIKSSRFYSDSDIAQRNCPTWWRPHVFCRSPRGHNHTWPVDTHTTDQYTGCEEWRLLGCWAVWLLVFLRGVLRLLVTVSVVPSSRILVTLMKEALSSFATLVIRRATRRNIPEGGILHSRRRENLKSYTCHKLRIIVNEKLLHKAAKCRVLKDLNNCVMSSAITTCGNSCRITTFYFYGHKITSRILDYENELR